MAYFGGGYGAGYGAPMGGAFGGYPGGYNQTPGGGIIPSGFVNPMTGLSPVGGLGSNLPSVDPNTFPGTVHFGPASTYSGELPGQFPPAFGGYGY